MAFEFETRFLQLRIVNVQPTHKGRKKWKLDFGDAKVTGPIYSRVTIGHIQDLRYGVRTPSDKVNTAVFSLIGPPFYIFWHCESFRNDCFSICSQYLSIFCSHIFFSLVLSIQTFCLPIMFSAFQVCFFVSSLHPRRYL